MTKEIVGQEIAKRVKGGDTIGVGTGSTVDVALQKMAENLGTAVGSVRVVPTSLETAWRCEDLGFTVLSSGRLGEIPWGFDGADVVDEELRLIKGGGAALLQEKVLAIRCRAYSIAVDESKLVKDISVLPVPVEVVPQARRSVEAALRRLGASEVVLRLSKGGKHGPVITEGGNIILDARFPKIENGLDAELKRLTGVIEHGLFLTEAQEVLVGMKDGVKVLKRDLR